MEFHPYVPDDGLCQGWHFGETDEKTRYAHADQKLLIFSELGTTASTHRLYFNP